MALARKPKAEPKPKRARKPKAEPQLEVAADQLEVAADQLEVVNPPAPKDIEMSWL